MLAVDKILFPTDFSRCSRQAFNEALFLAGELEAELTASVPAGLETSCHVTSGRAASDIVQTVEALGSDLVVNATHGLTGLSRLLFGSTAEEVVRETSCPVFTVKPFGRSLVAS